MTTGGGLMLILIRRATRAVDGRGRRRRRDRRDRLGRARSLARGEPRVARAFGGRHECRHTVTRRFGFTDDADARDVRERADADARARHARVDAARVSTRVDARASGG